MEHLLETDDRCITQLANMIIDSELVELTADVVIYRINFKKDRVLARQKKSRHEKKKCRTHS